MHCFAHGFITPERKGYITYTTTHLCKRHSLFNDPGSFYKIYCVVVVLFNTSSNGKNVRVKNDILRCKAYFIYQYIICFGANVYTAVECVCLPLFIKCHHYYRCSKTLADKCLVYKLLHTFFHGDGV